MDGLVRNKDREDERPRLVLQVQVELRSVWKRHEANGKSGCFYFLNLIERMYALHVASRAPHDTYFLQTWLVESRIGPCFTQQGTSSHGLLFIVRDG
jgi:hypothetical protein